MVNSLKKKPLLLVTLLIVVAVIGGILIKTHNNSKTRQNLAVTKTKSAARAATSKPRAPAAPTHPNLNPGGTVDNDGKTTGSLPPSSAWVSSASGVITLQQPSPNTSIANGDTISGTASVQNVTFILKDDSVGLIDQGTLNVVNGKFSGLMEFQAHSSSGTLEVYYPSPTNGKAEDVIEINVTLHA